MGMRILATLGLIALLVQPAPARALDVQAAALRLASIDSDLTRCLRERLLVALIVVRAVRDCIAERRPDESALRGDLNDGISTLAGDDPVRRDALSLREVLTLYRGFMNRLDGQLRPMSADHVERVAIARALDHACAIILQDETGGLSAIRIDLELPELCAQQ
ncbi:MAG: hypothetical protein KDK12_07495 [Rhodobacteraceae bacterium]|nr:hypothetical protein [Paracoccaceae bacterium]